MGSRSIGASEPESGCDSGEGVARSEEIIESAKSKSESLSNSLLPAGSGMGTHDPGKALEWNPAPRKRRRGEASGSRVEGGVEKRVLIPRSGPASEVLLSLEEGCREVTARGE